MGVDDFALGDEVRHQNGSVGRVVAIGPDRFGDKAVHVTFGPTPGPRYPKREWHGTYSDEWFRTNRLTKVVCETLPKPGH